jgi:transcriptional regulator with XRE-family HTH domain
VPEVNILLEIGKNIKRIRLEKGMSQQELAAMCNFEKSNMSRIEAGATNPTILTLYKISSALDIHIIDILKF